jgi:hypothetical protein
MGTVGWVEEGARRLARSAGESPAQVRLSGPPGGECCVSRRQRRPRSVHNCCTGCVIEPRNVLIAGGGDFLNGRTQHEQDRYARSCSPCRGRRAHHEQKDRVGNWEVPRLADGKMPQGPCREGAEPKPTMYGRGKSDEAVVAMKPANKAERFAEGRWSQGPRPRGMQASTARSGLSARPRVSPASAAYAPPPLRGRVWTRGRSRMRESRTYGSVRGAGSNLRPYRDRGETHCWVFPPALTRGPMAG